MSKISSLITGTDYDLADALFNSTSAETGEGAVSNNVTRIEAVARADSDSGTVTVDFGGETVSGDNLQAVEVDATVSVKEGDKVLVTVANGKPIVTGVLGWGDTVSAEIEANKKAIQDTVDAVDADIADVKAKADELAGELDSANQKIEQVATDVDGVKTTATNAVEKAEQSLTVATEAKQTATEIKTTADKAYEDAESALKQSSEALQTADGLSAKVTEAAETANSAYSAATSAEQTATGLKQTVEENYLTKDAAAGEYATVSRVSAIEQDASAIKLSVKEANDTADSALAAANSGITKVEVQYAQNQSSSTAPTSGWSATAPTWKDGYYIWQRTVTTYKNGNTSTSTATCISGAKGATGATGAAGKDGVGYKANLIIGSAGGGTDYAAGRGTLVDGGWNGNKAVSTNTAWSGYYIKTKQICDRNNIAAGTTMTASIYVSCDSDTAQTVTLSAHRFNTSTNTQTGNQITVTLKAGEWYRWVLTYTTNASASQGNIARFECRTATDFNILWSSPMLTEGTEPAEWSLAASELVGTGVSAITPQYYLSSSNTTQTGGSWVTTCPAWSTGKYIWTRSACKWTNGTTTYTTPVLDNALNGLGQRVVTVEQTAEAVETKVATLEGDVETQATLIRQSGNGVEVARKVDGAYTSTKGVFDETGLNVVEVDSDGNEGESLSQFGTTARIGKSSGNHIEIDNAQARVHVKGLADPVTTFDASGLAASYGDFKEQLDIGDYRMVVSNNILQWFYKGGV